MKKTTVKRIITTILAVATVGSTAALFAGCGEKSPEEKAKDAISDMYNKYKNSSKKSSEEEEEEKETVELNLLDKIVSDKLYTLKLYNKEYAGGFYIRLNDVIDIDGYTVELRDKKDEYDSGSKDWDIKKDGEKLASFEMDRDTNISTEINNNKITVSISAYDLTSEENSEVEFKFTETERDDIEVDVPAALTHDECKQHIDELKAAAWDEFKDDLARIDGGGKDRAHPKLEGVYYFSGDYGLLGDSENADKAHILFDFSVNMDEDVISFDPDNVRGVITYPVIFDGELKFIKNYTIKSYGDIDLSKSIKIG